MVLKARGKGKPPLAVAPAVSALPVASARSTASRGRGKGGTASAKAVAAKKPTKGITRAHADVSVVEPEAVPKLKKKRVEASALRRLGQLSVEDVAKAEPDVSCGFCDKGPDEQTWADYIHIPAGHGVAEQNIPTSGRCKRCFTWVDVNLGPIMNAASALSMAKSDLKFKLSTKTAILKGWGHSAFAKIGGGLPQGVENRMETKIGFKLSGPFFQDEAAFKAYVGVDPLSGGVPMSRGFGPNHQGITGYPSLHRDKPSLEWYMEGSVADLLSVRVFGPEKQVFTNQGEGYLFFYTWTRLSVFHGWAGCPNLALAIAPACVNRDTTYQASDIRGEAGGGGGSRPWLNTDLGVVNADV